EQELQIGVELKLIIELVGPAVDRLRLAEADRRLPVAPLGAAMRCFERREERVVVQPTVSTSAKVGELLALPRRRPGRKALERAPQQRELEGDARAVAPRRVGEEWRARQVLVGQQPGVQQ